MCFLLFVEDVLETADLLLHISINFQISRNYVLHLIHVLVNVAIFLPARILQRRNQLTLLRKQLGRFLQILQMFGSQDVLLLHDIVDFLVECKQILIKLLTTVKRLTQIIHLKFLLLG